MILHHMDKDCYFFLRILLGRMFFQIGQLDNWQVAPFIIGNSNTGKSTLFKLIAACFGDNNIATMGKDDKKFVLGSILAKDICLLSDVKDIKSMIDEDTIQNMISGDNLAMRQMHTSSENVKWVQPLAANSNFFPDFKDPAGALKRRFVIFDFKNPVKEISSTLTKDLCAERPSIIKRCVGDYLSYVQIMGTDANFNGKLPDSLLELKEILKDECDPLSKFLNLPKTKVGEFYYDIQYDELFNTPVVDFKKRFENWMEGHNEKDYKFDKRSQEFLERGYILKRITTCKSCEKSHLKGCCGQYNAKNKSTKDVFLNMKMIKETECPF